MSASTDSLRKKVCVTVFLDELFEEVYTDESEKLKESDGETKSELAISDKEKKKPVAVRSTPQKKSENLPKEGARSKESDSRPRKHRKESKFSKNPYKILKNFNRYDRTLESRCYRTSELKHEKSLETKFERRARSPKVSALSESDADDRTVAKISNKKKDNVSPFGESDGDQESAQTDVCCKCANNGSESMKMLDVNCQYDVTTYSSKFTQVESNAVDIPTNDVGDSMSLLEEEQKQIVEDLAWKKTQKQIQLILAKAKDWYEVKEPCEGDRIRRYDLRSILEDCEGADGRGGLLRQKTVSLTEGWSTDFYESDTKDLSDSYTCVFPHNKRHHLIKSPGQKRIYSKRLGQREVSFDSDLSEVDYVSYDEGLSRVDFHKLLCYTSCVNCDHDAFQEDPVQEAEEGVVSLVVSNTTVQESSIESIKSKCTKASKESYKTHESDEKVTFIQDYSLLKEKSISNCTDETSSKLDLPSQVEARVLTLNPVTLNLEHFEALEKSNNKTSKELLCLESKEKMIICDEILKKVDEVPESKLPIGPKEIEIIPACDKSEKKSPASPNSISEVFVKRQTASEKERSLLEVESETIFADINMSESKEFYCETSCSTVQPGMYSSTEQVSRGGVCVLEFEDDFPKSKVLRRMRTVEIMGNGSTKDMRNISAEVILICENISHEDVCLEAWQSNASILKSSTEVGQCYLKDSKDNSMYLIEIPFLFTRAKKHQLSEV